MSRVYVSHNNIISSLGFTSEAVVAKISNEVSGLQRIDDKSILPEPFYTSLVPTDILQENFKKLNPKGDYTRLEQMMITSLSNVINASNVKLNDRVGLIISTTKGNVDALDNNNPFHKDRAYLSELGNQVKDFFNFKNDAIVVSNACVSGVLAVAIAKRYIQQDVYDHVFITSGDVITEFILSGFNSFQALSSEPCKPYDANRTGINIGEVAASVVVTNNADALAKEAVTILGEGSCNDANHISGPSRTGEGLYKSMQSAFTQADISAEEVDFISAHGTATMFNDEMEAIAFNRMQLSNVPLNSLKGYFGHSLGASGLVETIVGMHSLKNNTLYKSLGFETSGVTQPINVITKTTNKNINRFLKTASGFGGCNTAILFQKTLIMSNQSIKAIDAIQEAQKIAMAPFVFQATVSLRKLGIFDLIFEKRKKGGITIEAIAEELKLSTYGVGVLLEIAESSDIVSKNETEHYELTTIGYFLAYNETVNVNLNFTNEVCYKGLFHLDEAIKTGKPTGLKELGDWPTVYEGLSQLTPLQQKSWFDFDHHYSDDIFEEALGILFKKDRKKIFDIGANTGKFTVKCCTYNSDVNITMIDLPGQLNKAKANVEKAGFQDRVKGHEIDWLSDNPTIPSDAETIWMSQFLDCFSKEEILKVLKTCVNSMDENSELIIIETFTDRQKFDNAKFILEATSLYFTVIANGNSKMYKATEFQDIAKEAGLQLNEDVEIGEYHTMFTFSKA